MCNHSAWLQINGGTQPSISTSFRLDKLCSELPNPYKQYPSTVFFLGRAAKDRALKDLFPYNNTTRRGRKPSFADIHIDNSTSTAEYPVYFAESDPFSPHEVSRALYTCHETKSFPLNSRQSSSKGSFHTIVYCQLLFLFCDIICVFGDDFKDLNEVLSLIGSWICQGSSSDLPATTRPHILVVRSSDGPTDFLRTEDLRPNLTNETPYDASDIFSSINLVQLPRKSLSPVGRYRALRELLLSTMHKVRLRKLKERCHFSAVHMAALFNHRLPDVACNAAGKFDLVRASRLANSVNIDHKKFLSIFLKICLQRKLPYKDIASFIASSIILNAFPPSMHKFDPQKVFEKLYGSSCTGALIENCDSKRFVAYLGHLIQDHFKEFFRRIEMGQTAADVHRANILAKSRHLKHIKSNQICLCCLMSKPEHVLGCGHSLCDDCVQIFGNQEPVQEHCYRVVECMMCETASDLLVHLKPPTAGARILSIDGGGVRGIVPLEFLNLLQTTLGDNLKIQDLFDLAVGTSAGGLIVLGLFRQQWSVSRCIDTFKEMTHRFFGTKSAKCHSMLNRVQRYFKGVIADGCYDAENMERALQESFGGTSRLFDHPAAKTSKSKVAVTATSISNAVTFLFSNYNGSGKRPTGSGYKLWRPLELEDEPHSWEAARATSAAPLFFKPARLRGGTFQDGGMKHNNPINLAKWETRRIWTDTAPFDVVFSLGTGSALATALQSPKAPHFRHILKDGSLHRIGRALLSLVDGENMWTDFDNGIHEDDKGDYFRFNIFLKGTEPELDDVSCVDVLSRTVQEQFSNHKSLKNIAIALLASCFYFELDRRPTFQEGFWLCEGTIHCRHACRQVIETLQRLVEGPLELMMSSQAAQPIELGTYVCRDCGRFTLPISFLVRHPSEVVTVYLVLGHEGKRKISGFPQSMAWFVSQQQLGSTFGKRDHTIGVRIVCETCDPPTEYPHDLKRKRKLGSPPLRAISKRSRVHWF